MKITINYAMSSDLTIAEQVKQAGYILRDADTINQLHEDLNRLYIHKIISYLEYRRLLQKLHEKVKENVTCHLSNQ